jgi:hypothetical protein
MPVGSCPECGGDIADSSVLIEYEASGTESMFAECPACSEVVHPK